MALTGSLGGAAVAIAKVEIEYGLLAIFARHFQARQVVFNFDHAAKLLEILARCGTLDSEKFLDG